VEDHVHPATAHLGATWPREDEWYNYRRNPRTRVHVLLSLDESTYSGGTMGDHPSAWCHTVGAGRAFYTGGGHAASTFVDQAFRTHLLGGIETGSRGSGRLFTGSQQRPMVIGELEPAPVLDARELRAGQIGPPAMVGVRDHRFWRRIGGSGVTGEAERWD